MPKRRQKKRGPGPRRKKAPRNPRTPKKGGGKGGKRAKKAADAADMKYLDTLLEEREAAQAAPPMSAADAGTTLNKEEENVLEEGAVAFPGGERIPRIHPSEKWTEDPFTRVKELIRDGQKAGEEGRYDEAIHIMTETMSLCEELLRDLRTECGGNDDDDEPSEADRLSASSVVSDQWCGAALTRGDFKFSLGRRAEAVLDFTSVIRRRREQHHEQKHPSGRSTSAKTTGLTDSVLSRAYSLRAIGLQRLDDPEFIQSISDCNEALSLLGLGTRKAQARTDRRTGSLYMSRGTALFQLGEYERALADFSLCEEDVESGRKDSLLRQRADLQRLMEKEREGESAIATSGRSEGREKEDSDAEEEGEVVDDKAKGIRSTTTIQGVGSVGSMDISTLQTTAEELMGTNRYEDAIRCLTLLLRRCEEEEKGTVPDSAFLAGTAADSEKKDTKEKEADGTKFHLASHDGFPPESFDIAFEDDREAAKIMARLDAVIATRKVGIETLQRDVRLLEDAQKGIRSRCEKRSQCRVAAAAALRSRARCWLRKEYFILACHDANCAIQWDPENGEGYTLRGIGWFGRKQFQLAQSDWEKAVSLDEARENREARFHIGLCWQMSKDYRGAIAAYTDALNPRPGDFYGNEVWLKRGECRMFLEQFDDAIADFSEFIRLKPPADELARAISHRADCWTSLEKWEDAISDLSDLIQMKDVAREHRAAHVFERGWCYEKLGRADDAMKSYSEFIAESEHNPLSEELLIHALLWRSCRYADEGNLAKAEKDLNEQMRLYPDDVEQTCATLIRRGSLKRGFGRCDEAAADFAHVIETGTPIAANPHKWRASVRSSKETTAAVEDLVQACLREPTYLRFLKRHTLWGESFGVSVERAMQSSRPRSKPSRPKCNHCGRTGKNLPYCDCGLVCYCSPKCRKADTQHRTTHERFLRPGRSRCANCGEAKPKLCCSGCGLVSYCTKDCQAGDWRRHKPFCAHSSKKKAKRSHGDKKKT